MPHGTIIVCTSKGKASFGFVRPRDGSANVYFGAKASFGKSLRKGIEVEFEYGNFRPGKGPSAMTLKPIVPVVASDPEDDDREDITEIYGDDPLSFIPWSQIR